MKTTNLLHISLGSNMGDRLAFLQAAVTKIYATIGDVIAISGVYQTPAWGFSSADFLNACISLRTSYAAAEVLERLQLIEKNLGRTAKTTTGYEARPIDLDIIFMEGVRCDTPQLTVPHPAMQDRKFVLVPLAEIAATVVHPVLGLTVEALLERTPDTSQITLVSERLVQPKTAFSFAQWQYLTIEGNIGAGKTSLSRLIAQEFNAKLVLERFEDNPFLPKFYEDMERYAFPLEMSFLADRYQHLQEDIAQFDLFKDFVVSDYNVSKSLVFAQITLQEEEWKLYKKVFDIMYKELPTPKRYVYLYQHTERLLSNIKQRGRSYEKDISAAYLEKIHKGYLQFLKTQSRFEYTIIDVSDKDFVGNREDYYWVLEQLNTL